MKHDQEKLQAAEKVALEGEISYVEFTDFKKDSWDEIMALYKSMKPPTGNMPPMYWQATSAKDSAIRGQLRSQAFKRVWTRDDVDVAVSHLLKRGWTRGVDSTEKKICILTGLGLSHGADWATIVPPKEMEEYCRREIEMAIYDGNIHVTNYLTSQTLLRYGSSNYGGANPMLTMIDSLAMKMSVGQGARARAAVVIFNDSVCKDANHAVRAVREIAMRMDPKIRSIEPYRYVPEPA